MAALSAMGPDGLSISLAVSPISHQKWIRCLLDPIKEIALTVCDFSMLRLGDG